MAVEAETAQACRLRSLEIIAHRAGGHAATAGNLPDRELVLEAEPQDFFDLTHGFGSS